MLAPAGLLGIKGDLEVNALCHLEYAEQVAAQNVPLVF